MVLKIIGGPVGGGGASVEAGAVGVGEGTVKVLVRVSVLLKSELRDIVACMLCGWVDGSCVARLGLGSCVFILWLG